MAKPKVFVSSTAFDLGAVRSSLRSFIESLGYEPVLSDYADVLYDPREHTHSSCINEVANTDMAVLVVGSRFGGTAVPNASDLIDFERLREDEQSIDELGKEHRYSITQLEVMRIIELGLPLFAFIDQRVWADHLGYEKNKHQDWIDNYSFPSIEKPTTAKYIFTFINFLRHRAKNNAIFQFTRMEDITTQLEKQWAGLFQRLLREQRLSEISSRQVDGLAEQIDDLKTAMLTTIGDDDARKIAQGVVRYRTLSDFLSSLGLPTSVVAETDDDWKALLRHAGVQEFLFLRGGESRRRPTTIVVLDDTNYIESRYTTDRILDLEYEWEQFVNLSSQLRRPIFEAHLETDNRIRIHRRVGADRVEELIARAEGEYERFAVQA